MFPPPAPLCIEVALLINLTVHKKKPIHPLSLFSLAQEAERISGRNFSIENTLSLAIALLERKKKDEARERLQDVLHWPGDTPMIRAAREEAEGMLERL
jgi:hypothetical protein